MDKKYIIALDEGTTSARAIIFDKKFNIVDSVQHEFTQIYPKPSFVEHNPLEIFSCQYAALNEVIAKSGINVNEIAAIGITNQRETTIVWDKNTGEPVYNAIVWQCRRTSDICEQLKADGLEEYISEKTGLKIDAYFSGTKIKWILDNVEGARQKAERGDLLFGTVDTWLIWKLTEGKVHITDYTNASRTMLFDIHSLCWDEKILDILDIPSSMLPKVCPSAMQYGTVNLFGRDIAICGIAGDQQAALFGQRCFSEGDIKNTYGTGCFLLMNTGDKPYKSKNGLLTTIAATPCGQKIQYALEGSVFVGGAVIQWLRDELNLITTSAESEACANEVVDSQGVYIVPAFAGLGAPYWDMYARGTICGLTRGSNKNHIVRAALESIAYQSDDLIEAMRNDTGINISSIRADGGASANKFLMQFQADISASTVYCSKNGEATALGAAMLAGIACGFWNTGEIAGDDLSCICYQPILDEKNRSSLKEGWKKAIKSTLGG